MTPDEHKIHTLAFSTFRKLFISIREVHYKMMQRTMCANKIFGGGDTIKTTSPSSNNFYLYPHPVLRCLWKDPLMTPTTPLQASFTCTPLPHPPHLPPPPIKTLIIHQLDKLDSLLALAFKLFSSNSRANSRARDFQSKGCSRASHLHEVLFCSSAGRQSEISYLLLSATVLPLMKTIVLDHWHQFIKESVSFSYVVYRAIVRMSLHQTSLT